MYAREYLELRDVEVAGRSNSCEDGLRLARGAVNVESELNHPLDHVLYRFIRSVVLHRYDHCFRPLP